MPKPTEDEGGKNLAKSMIDFCNHSCRSYKFLVDEIMRSHRFLQQELFCSVILNLIRAWAALPENNFDPRNEYTVHTCRKIMKALESSR